MRPTCSPCAEISADSAPSRTAVCSVGAAVSAATASTRCESASMRWPSKEVAVRRSATTVLTTPLRRSTAASVAASR